MTQRRSKGRLNLYLTKQMIKSDSCWILWTVIGFQMRQDGLSCWQGAKIFVTSKKKQPGLEPPQKQTNKQLQFLE